jgi:hypothetical protein
MRSSPKNETSQAHSTDSVDGYSTAGSSSHEPSRARHVPVPVPERAGDPGDLVVDVILRVAVAAGALQPRGHDQPGCLEPGWLGAFPMSTRVDDGFTSVEIDGRVIATARERADGWWGGQLLAPVLRLQPGDNGADCHRVAGERAGE